MVKYILIYNVKIYVNNIIQDQMTVNNFEIIGNEYEKKDIYKIAKNKFDSYQVYSESYTDIKKLEIKKRCLYKALYQIEEAVISQEEACKMIKQGKINEKKIRLIAYEEAI